MKRAALLLALFLCLPVSAQALSCIAPDPVADYIAADQSPDLWVLVTGRLTFDETRLPKTDWAQQDRTPPETAIPARLRGHSLGPDGFATGFDRSVTLRVTCAGPWCGGARSGERYLAFLRKAPEGFVLFAHACPTMLYARPDDALLERMHSCFRGGPCTPQSNF